MQQFIDATFLACIEIDHLLKQREPFLFEALDVGHGGDISFKFDLEAEAIFVRHLHFFGVINSEESGSIKSEINHASEFEIVLDPVDGSDNYKSRFPYYGTSIALKKDATTVVAIVCNFANGECFVRCDGNHYVTNLATLHKKEPVRINASCKVGIFEKALNHFDKINQLKEKNLKFRAPGAVALSLAYAHYVNYVVFLGKMRAYDIEAGLYLASSLYCYQSDEIILISHNKQVFQTLQDIFIGD